MVLLVAGKLKPRKPKAAPAPTRHRSASPLETLVKRGVLNIHEHTAADEIIASYQMAAGRPVTRDPDLGIVPSPARPDGADGAAARRCDILVTYGRWKADLAREWPFVVTIRVLLEEQTLSDVDTWGGWRKGTARDHLLAGLRHFAALRGNTPRGVRGWKWREAA